MDKEKQIKRAIEQLAGKGNLEVIGNIFSINYIAHAGDKDYKGHGFIKRFTKQFRSAIQDVKILKVEFLNQSGNIITWQRSLMGIHKEKMRGIPPSGKKIKWTEMGVSRFENGKIAEEWVVSELAGQLALKTPKN